jgi:hypothetical protein
VRQATGEASRAVRFARRCRGRNHLLDERGGGARPRVQSLSRESAADRNQPAGFSQAVGRERQESRDIVADNLDRVAASPEQILDLLGKDPGLMVEFKKLLAEDAGASGQILEEADLAEEAIAERLNSDLHSRVLATQLLRRYGYLQPKVNPGSDVAAERSLLLQARTYALTHAAARERGRLGTPQPEVACDLQESRDCQEQEPASSGDLRITELANPEDRNLEPGSSLESPPSEIVPGPPVQASQTLKASLPSGEGMEALFSAHNGNMLEESAKPEVPGKGTSAANRDFANSLGGIPPTAVENPSENGVASRGRGGNACCQAGMRQAKSGGT